MAMVVFDQQSTSCNHDRAIESLLGACGFAEGRTQAEQTSPAAAASYRLLSLFRCGGDSGVTKQKFVSACVIEPQC